MNGLTYLTFSVDHPQDKAVETFIRRFGKAPKEVQLDSETRGVRLLRVGPVEEEKPQMVLKFDEA